jgi:hypothetical protein
VVSSKAKVILSNKKKEIKYHFEWQEAKKVKNAYNYFFDHFLKIKDLEVLKIIKCCCQIIFKD